MWYVYVYCNVLKESDLHYSGFEPFYVGKGCGDRCDYHLHESDLRTNSNKHKTNTIKKILRANMTPLILKEANFFDESSAYEYEKELIKHYGRADLKLGPLTNMTDGGEGESGRIKSPELRAQISARMKEEYKDGRRARPTAAWIKLGKLASMTPEAIAKNAASRLGKKASEEARANITKGRQRFVASLTPEQRKEHFNTTGGTKLSEEHIAKMSASLKIALKTPEAIANRSAANSNGNNPSAKGCEYDGIRYDTINQASAATGIYRSKLKKLPLFKFL